MVHDNRPCEPTVNYANWDDLLEMTSKCTILLCFSSHLSMCFDLPEQQALLILVESNHKLYISLIPIILRKQSIAGIIQILYSAALFLIHSAIYTDCSPDCISPSGILPFRISSKNDSFSL